MGTRTSRRLAAILAADLVGYSRLMEADEDGTIAALQLLHGEVFGRAISGHSGRLVSTAGDSLLVEYPSAVSAVRSAIEMQASLADRGARQRDGRPIAFRIGINVGDVVVAGDDLLGDGVNIAARLEALATPGGICISGAMREHAATKLGLDLRDLGNVSLKNISRDVHAYEIAGDAETGTALPVGSGKVGTRGRAIDFSRFERASIVILPFRDLGGADTDCLGEGLRLSLHSVLIKLSGLFLVHTAAAEKFRDRDASPVEAGREVGVHYVVTGAVQRAANRVRILVDLTDVAAGQVIWADRLDQRLDDIFSFQDDVAREIVNTIGIELRGGDLRRASYATPSSAEALACLHRTVSHLYRGTREDTRIARDWGAKLLALEPGNANAFGIVALTHWRDGTFGWSDDPEGSLDLAAEYAQRAVDSGDPEGVGMSLLASAHLHAERYDEAMEAASEARRHRPSCPLSNGILADVLRYCGDADQAVLRVRGAIDHARTLPPWMANTLAASLRDAGDIAASIEAAGQAAQLFPDDVDTMVTLCCDHILAEETGVAREVAARILRADPQFSISDYTASQPYKDPAMRARLTEMLKAAGLPE